VSRRTARGAFSSIVCRIVARDEAGHAITLLIVCLAPLSAESRHEAKRKLSATLSVAKWRRRHRDAWISRRSLATSTFETAGHNQPGQQRRSY
jgi:hypothetical protein